MKAYPCSTALVLSLVSAASTAQEDPIESNEANSQIALDPYTVVAFPLEVVGKDPRTADLAAAAYDDLLTRLAAIEGLLVLGRDSLSPYARSELAPAEIARQLGAAHALSGSVWVGDYALNFDFDYIHAGTGDETCSRGFGARPGERRPIKVYPDKLLPSAIPPTVECISTIVFPEREPDPQQELDELAATFLDVSLPERERIDALRDLIHPGASRGEYIPPQRLPDAVLVAAVQMALSSDDHWMREGVWTHLENIRELYLIEPLLHSLANDDDERVRKAAAITLRNYLDEPGVTVALEDAGSTDSSAEVRQEAHFGVISPEEKRAGLMAVAMDETLSDEERSRAFGELWSEPVGSNDLSPALISAMVDLAQGSEDGRVRWTVWFNLGYSGSADVVQPLLKALQDDPDEEVRATVAGALRHFLAEPAVREGLEIALTGDSSELVRRRVEEALIASPDY